LFNSQDNGKPSFAYHEPADALQNRIQSHAMFGSFNLHKWIGETIPMKSGDAILDMGCGDGNYTDLFLEKIGPTGRILGFDKNPILITKAVERFKKHSLNQIRFTTSDFDHPLPTQDKFNWVFAIYSLYYTENIEQLLQQVTHLLLPSGSFVVIGPGALNAKDLEGINQRVTGKTPSARYLGTLERVEREFRPLFESHFGIKKVDFHMMDSYMSFPSAQEFADYYWSTLLWRESTAELSANQIVDAKALTLDLVSIQLPIKINKQLSCLTGSV